MEFAQQESASGWLRCRKRRQIQHENVDVPQEVVNEVRRQTLLNLLQCFYIRVIYFNAHFLNTAKRFPFFRRIFIIHEPFTIPSSLFKSLVVIFMIPILVV